MSVTSKKLAASLRAEADAFEQIVLEGITENEMSSAHVIRDLVEAGRKYATSLRKCAASVEETETAKEEFERASKAVVEAYERGGT